MDPRDDDGGVPAAPALPCRITVRASDLPPATLAWLQEQTPDPARKLLWSQTRRRDLLALAPGIVLAWWAIGIAAGGGAWTARDVVELAAFSLLAALALAFGAPRFHAALVAPLPRCKLLHSSYYIEVDDRVHFFPLVHVREVAAVRRRARGASARTDAVLRFGGRARRVPFFHMDGADRFVQEVLRRRQLSLQPRAAPPGPTGLDLVPARFRTHANPDLRWRWQAGGAVLTAAIAFGAAAVVQAREARTPLPAVEPPALTVRVRWSEPPTAAADCPFAPERAPALLTRALQEALDRVNGADAVRLVTEPSPGAGSLDLAITARPGASYRLASASAPAGASALGARVLEFTATLRAPGAAPQEVRGSASPPLDVVAAPEDRARPPETGCDAVRAAELAGLAREIAHLLRLELPSTGATP